MESGWQKVIEISHPGPGESKEVPWGSFIGPNGMIAKKNSSVLIRYEIGG